MRAALATRTCKRSQTLPLSTSERTVRKGNPIHGNIAVMFQSFLCDWSPGGCVYCVRAHVTCTYRQLHVGARAGHLMHITGGYCYRLPLLIVTMVLMIAVVTIVILVIFEQCCKAPLVDEAQQQEDTHTTATLCSGWQETEGYHHKAKSRTELQPASYDSV